MSDALPKPTPRPRLFLREVLDILEQVEVNLSSMMRRWQGESISPEIRAEIMTDAYEPVLAVLIRGERRGRAGAEPEGLHPAGWKR